MHHCHDLNVDEEKIKNLLKEHDIETTARILGHDIENYDHIKLAGRLLVAGKHIPENISIYLEAFDDFLSEKVKLFLRNNERFLNDLLEETKHMDYFYDWVSINTLYKTYLAKSEIIVNGIKYVESPRFCFLRQAVHMYEPEVEEVTEAYLELCSQLYLHATPTNTNGGKVNSQCSSCFLLTLEDNLESITEVGVHKCAIISKSGGGLGLDISRIRHSEIKHAGMSQGVIPMLVMFNHTIRYVNQCFAKGSIIYTNEGFLPIEDLLPGQKVLTVDGSFQKILKVLPYRLEQEKKAYAIRTAFGKAKVLADHPMYSGRACPLSEIELEYRAAEEISEGDYIYYPVPQVQDLDYTPEELYIYGIIYKLGKVDEEKTSLPYSERSENILKLLGVKYASDGENISFVTGSLRITPRMSKIIPIAFYSLPHEKALALYEGLQEDDKYLALFLGKLRYPKYKDGYLIPVIRIEEETASFVYDLEVENNHNFSTEIGLAHNGGRRKGAMTTYLRIHHIDVMEFMKVNSVIGETYSRAYDLDIALWVPWIFWKRVREDGDWSLFCPKQTPELNDIWGIEFSRKYEEIEKSIVPRKTLKARQVFEAICKNQQAGNKLYTLGSDAANFKSNQKNLGYIRCSNLCTEIIQYSAEDEYASCNLAQISLTAMVKEGELDYDLLAYISRKVCKNLNRIIERNWYPLKEIYKSNNRHRPMGIGVSGFADMLALLDLAFEDEEVRYLNKRVFACIYFNALIASIQESILKGPYETFEGSPASQGKLQFDLWAEEYELLKKEDIPMNRDPKDDIPIDPSEWGQDRYVFSNGDFVLPTWDDLKRCIKLYGLRNSLLVAPMPTATSSIVLGNGESTEAPQSNIFARTLLSGNYPVVNKYLWKDLLKLGLWNIYTVNLIQADEGSISKLDKLIKVHPEYYPQFNGNWERLRFVQRKYKTMWELPQVLFLKMAAERGRYICQSQSTNLYFSFPKISALQKAQLFASESGLKTYIYYVRQTAAAEPLKITIDNDILKFVGKKEQSKIVCTDEVCISCQ